MYLNHSRILPCSKTLSDNFSICLHPGVPQQRHQVSYLNACTQSATTLLNTKHKTHQQSKLQSIRCYLPHCLWKMASVCVTDMKLSVPKISELRACNKRLPPKLPSLLLLLTTRKRMYLFLFILTCLSVCLQLVHLLLPLKGTGRAGAAM